MSRPHLPPWRIDRATLPPWLMTSEPGSFAHKTLKERNPRILDELLAQPFFSPDIRRGLMQLRDEILNGVVQPLVEVAPDTDFWNEVSQPYFGQSWLAAPWYWAETYFYRRILQAVGYFQSGEWYHRDPFASQKDAELRPEAAPQRVALVLSDLPADAAQRFETLAHAAMWGNRIDLSHRFSHAATPVASLQAERANLLVDDTPRVWEFLTARPIAHLLYVADNAGAELALDLAWIDFLLSCVGANGHPLVQKITLYLKPQPFFVSDAMPEDAEKTLRALSQASPEARALARRVREYREQRRLVLRTHWFFPTCLHYFEMPDDLFALFRAARFIIFKGDVNYRRLVGDAHWPPTTPFEYATRYLPTPFVCLRTLKAELILGLEAGQAEALSKLDPEWQVNGQRGVIQANLVQH